MPSIFQIIESRDWGSIPNHLHEARDALDADLPTPLHFALWQDAPLPVVTLLLESYPGAAKVKDRLQFTPLHLACFHESSSLPIIELILKSCPEAVLEKSKRGRTPLHDAFNHETEPLAVMKLLLRACPKAALEKDDFGETPLHRACLSKRASLPLTQLLLESCPEAALIRSNYGQTPLAKACRSGEILKVRLLLESNHALAGVEDQKLRDFLFTRLYFPLKFGLEKAYSKKISKEEFLEMELNDKGNTWKVKDVCDVFSSFLKASSFSNENNGDSSLLLAAMNDPVIPWLWCEFIAFVHPEQINETNSSGQLPIHYFNPDSKKEFYSNLSKCSKDFCGTPCEGNLWLGDCNLACDKHVEHLETNVRTAFCIEEEESSSLTSLLSKLFRDNPSCAKIAVKC